MKSVFFRRMFIMMLMVMLLTSAVMAAGCGLLSSRIYVGITLEEMTPRAETMAGIIEERQKGEISEAAMERIAASIMQSSDAMAIVFNEKMQPVLLSNFNTEIDADRLCCDTEAYAAKLISGESVSEPSVNIEGVGIALISGVPLRAESGEVIGGVMLIQNAQVIANGMRPITTLLYLAIAIGILLMTILVTWQLNQATNPLHLMTEVAIEMTKGKFDARANESEPGEVGILARALNNLCEELSRTIYQLRVEKGQLDELLQSLSDGVAAIDVSGGLTHYNAALMCMFGVVNVEKRDDLIKDPMVWSVFDEVCQTGESQTLTYPMAGDRTLWISISPVNTEDGKRTGVVGLFKDMTEMERTENMRREYVANVSHELRTPLTAVRGLLEPLADGMVTKEEDRQRYYKIMLHEVLRLSRLISDMLTLSRLQAGTEYMQLERVNLQDIINDVGLSYASAAEQKGIHLIVDCADTVDALTDPDRIEQVLVILIDNAMRYTPAGGSITVRLRSGKKLIVSVEDTGCGIPEKDVAHVFERFYKVDKSRGEGGTGLGLSIAKFVMEKMEENITVHSVVGEGTCFTFTVKRYVSNAIELGPPNSSRPASTEAGEEDNMEQGDIVDAQYELVPDAPDKHKHRSAIKIPDIKLPEKLKMPDVKKTKAKKPEKKNEKKDSKN